MGSGGARKGSGRPYTGGRVASQICLTLHREYIIKLRELAAQAGETPSKYIARELKLDELTGIDIPKKKKQETARGEN